MGDLDLYYKLERELAASSEVYNHAFDSAPISAESLQQIARQLCAVRYSGNPAAITVKEDDVQITEMGSLGDMIAEENRLLALAEGCRRHGIPVPNETTETIERLAREIKAEWRRVIDARIARREAEVRELQSREEKRKAAQDELVVLKQQREAMG